MKKTKYENLSKQAQPKKVLEALKKVKEIKEGKHDDVKKGVDLSALAKKIAQKKLNDEKEEAEE